MLTETHMLKKFITLTTIARMLSTLCWISFSWNAIRITSLLSLKVSGSPFSPVFLLPICISFLFKLSPNLVLKSIAWTQVFSHFVLRAVTKPLEIIKHRRFGSAENVSTTASSPGSSESKCYFKTDSVQSSSNTCKNYLLKIYSQHAIFLNAI